MKFIYIDESGLGEEPIAVMVGVIADSHRMRVTKQDWSNLLISLSRIVRREVKEIHTRDFYSGNSIWRDLDGTRRSEIIDAIFQWLVDRNHKVVYSAIDKANFNKNFTSEQHFEDIQSLWRCMALHLSLSVQKYFQGAVNGSTRKINLPGHCVLIFDNEKCEEKKFSDLLLNPPDWTDSYYNKKNAQEKFSQIIDVPHFVDSRDVGLIQLADFLCFFLRRYIELQLGYSQPDYSDEATKVAGWSNTILDASIPKSNIYMNRGRCNCADLFFRYSPSIIH